MTQGYRYYKRSGKCFGSSLGHTLNFCRNLVILNYFVKEYVSRNLSPGPLLDLVKLRRVKDAANFISLGLKIVKRLRRCQYYPLIIERMISLVLGPSTSLYRSFLKLCTLTNKAVGTIWRSLSKPAPRRQGPYPCPLWLQVGTTSVLGPSSRKECAEHILFLWISFDIFIYTNNI